MIKTTKSLPRRVMHCFVLLLALSLLSGCGAVSGESSLSSQSSSIAIMPATAQIRAGDTQLFVAKTSSSQPISPNRSNNPRPRYGADILRPTNSNVTWSVNGIPGGNATVGTIDAKGLYTAPAILPSPNFARVTTASVEEPSISATGLVTLYNPIPFITSISPTTVSVGGFTLTVLGHGFVKGAQVLLAGAVLQTAFNYSTQLTATGTAAQAHVGSMQILVKNPDPGSVRSASAVNLQVTAPSSIIQVALSPANAILQAGTSLQFTAAVPGTTSADFAWLADGVPGGNSASGIISPLGQYTTPQTVGSSTSVVLTARSKADPSQSGTAMVTVLPAPVPVTVSISPTSAALTTGQSRQLTATVTGTTNSGINWLVNGIDGGNSTLGTISSTGVYTAPQLEPSVPSVTITAKSSYNPGSSADATVTIIAGTPPAASNADATYYVDASAGNDGNDGRSPATAWRTIAKVNASSFSPGDSVLFNKGSTWREMLTPPSSGSAADPITFGAYGTGPNPVISGSDLLTTWTTEGSYYYKAVTLGPSVNAVTQTFFDGARLASVGSKGALGAGKWWWDAANMRVYIFDNPAGHTVEANTRLRALSLTAHSYVTFQNLHFTEANQDNIGVYSSARTPVVTNITLDHVLSDYAFEHGMFDYSPSPYAHNNVTISYSEFAFNIASGIEKNGIGDSWLVDHSSFHDNSLTNDNAFTGGIRFIASNSTDRATNATIQYSVAYNNGTDVAGIVSTAGDGFWFDTVGAGCKMISNLSYNNHDAGILVEASTGVIIQGNVVSGNANGIRFYNHVQNSKMYNNTVYGNTSINILMRGLFGGGDPGFIDNEVKNNISFGSGKSFLADYGGENDGTNGFGNVYTYNAFGVQATNFIQWGASTLSTYAAFEAAYGIATHSVAGDPKFKNAAGGDFSLLNGSPAVDTGTNLGAPYNLDNDPQGAFPWAIADQNDYGSGWDVGAFVFVP